MMSFAYIFLCPFTLLHLLPFNPSAEYLSCVMLRYLVTSLLLLRLLQRDDDKKTQILIPALTTFTTPGSWQKI